MRWNKAAVPWTASAVCWVLAAVGPAAAQSREQDEAELLRVHAEVIRAHVEGDVDLWMSLEGSAYVSVNGGRVTFPSLADRRSRRESYVGINTYTTYRDLREPIVRVSDDGTLGWLIAEVEIEGSAPGEGGELEAFHSVWAWIELYERVDGAWRLTGNASNPLEVPAEVETGPRVLPTPLSDDLTLLRVEDGEGGPVNTLLLRTSDGGLLVDHPGDWRTLRAGGELIEVVSDAVRRFGGAPLRYLVNTHWHGDHTAGNTVFPDAEVIAHEAVARRLSERQTPYWYPEGIGPMESEGWPDRTFTDSLVLDLDTERVTLWHFGPAHSDGDAVVYFAQADVAHMGDLFHGPGEASVGEDMEGMVRVFDATLARIGPETRVVTGHGDLSDADGLRRYRDMLADAIEHVERLVEDGFDLEAVVGSGLPAAWAGTLSENDVRFWYTEIYRSLVAPGRALPAPRNFRVDGSSFLAILVRDEETAARWYRRALGLREVSRIDAEDGRYGSRILEREGLTIELIRRNGDPEAPDGALGLFKAGFYVDDIDAAFDLLRSRGVDTDQSVFTDNTLPVRSFVFRDLEGNRLQVFQRCEGPCSPDDRSGSEVGEGPGDPQDHTYPAREAR